MADYNGFGMNFYFRVTLLLLGMWIGSVVTGEAAQCTLQWQASPDARVTGYKVYYHVGPSAPPYRGSEANEGSSPILVTLEDVMEVATGDTCEFTVTGLDASETYYFVVTAHDGHDNESNYSNEVCLNPRYAYECTLNPRNTRVWSTGFLEFEVTFRNNTAQFQYFLFATNITTPTGNSYPEPNYLLGPMWVSLPPYGSKSKEFIHRIPDNPNLGFYTYHAYVGQLGTGIHQEDRFIFAIMW